MNDNGESLARIEGEVIALGAAIATLVRSIDGIDEREYIEVCRALRDNYTDIPFVLSDEQAEGFRKVFDDLAHSLEHTKPPE